MELRSTRLREKKENEGPDAKKACSQLTEVNQLKTENHSLRTKVNQFKTEVNHLKTENHNLCTDIMVLVETRFSKNYVGT